jgi:hypothetical protein
MNSPKKERGRQVDFVLKLLIMALSVVAATCIALLIQGPR